MMNWDTNKTKSLIEEYRKRRILWDLRDPNYKNNRKKIKLWEELALKFDCSIKEIKSKVKNLRTTFHRYRKRRIRSDQSDQWVHFVSLRFLLNVNTLRKEISNYKDINFENEDDVEDQEVNDSTTQLKVEDEAPCSTEIEIEENVLHRSLTLDKSRVQERNSANTSLNPHLRAAGREFVKLASQLRKHRKQGIDKDEEARRADKAYKIFKNTSQRDEFATFGEHVANEIRKLNWTAQTIVKHHINNILFDAAMGKFDAPSSTHSVS
ncbi:uncharacterized protein [Linepithema humile]|uniref:uncharacterized protein n=1 Tax=Linepithema humile TaxID=83485 RepID=UPI000623095C|nr:PREDICTED: uncharacterized protein LOC105673131 [Linepithema humile]